MDQQNRGQEHVGTNPDGGARARARALPPAQQILEPNGNAPAFDSSLLQHGSLLNPMASVMADSGPLLQDADVGGIPVPDASRLAPAMAANGAPMQIPPSTVSPGTSVPCHIRA